MKHLTDCGSCFNPAVLGQWRWLVVPWPYNVAVQTGHRAGWGGGRTGGNWFGNQTCKNLKFERLPFNCLSQNTKVMVIQSEIEIFFTPNESWFTGNNERSISLYTLYFKVWRWHINNVENQLRVWQNRRQIDPLSVLLEANVSAGGGERGT